MTNTTLSWRKGIFNCAYIISRAGKQVGKLIENPWSQSARGEISNRKIAFRVRNALLSRAEIIDLNTRKKVGYIKFSAWCSRARINYGGNDYVWRYKNIWSTKWSLKDEQGNQLEYNGYSYKGTIHNEVEDEVLLLVGLFVGSYYWQMITIYIAVIIIPAITQWT